MAGIGCNFPGRETHYAVLIISFQGFIFYTLKGFFYYGYASPERIWLYH